MNRHIPLDVVEDSGSLLYISERKVYPRDVSGPLQRLRIAAVFWLLGMFYVFPSGLVLYYLTNNLLSIAQQYVINKRLGVIGK